VAYQSLYRRYRPGGFQDHLVGQEHVVAALRNAVKDGRVGHAYLFSGPRGTGKTTMARILAKALNCTNLSDDAEPCGVCDSCVAFAAGTSYDLHELDAASNNGVDAIRDLIGKVALGSPGRTKVYVLDEVHMLTSGAENALLKTLEEPPGHVVFVLCTTEPHKVVATIRSRTQHFVFELLSAEALANHVRWVGQDAGLDLDDAMVDYVVRAGRGSARDTLSALEKVVAAGGVPGDDDAVSVIVRALAARDAAAALTGVVEAMRSGRDPRVIGEQILGRLRDGFLAAVGGPLDQLTDADRRDAAELASVGPARLTRALELLGTALVDMRQAPDPRIDLEVALLRLTRAELDTDLAALVARVEQLESGAPLQVTAAEGSSPPRETPTVAAAAPGPRVSDDEAPVASAADLSPPAATASGGSGPAAAARARLAGARSEGASATSAPGATRGARAALGAHRKPAGNADPPRAATAASAAEEPPAPPSAAAPEPAAHAAPTASPPPDAPAPTSGAVAEWSSVLGHLSGRARSRYAGGHVIRSEAGRVVIGLPNAIHRDRCEECRGEVEDAYGALGSPVTIELVVDEGTAPSPPPGTAPLSAAAGAAAPPDKPTEEEAIDLADLVDAPSAEGDGINLITAAFPGAEVVDPDAT
jgi:DNA polymerase III subunit gamma/tau